MRRHRVDALIDFRADLAWVSESVLELSVNVKGLGWVSEAPCQGCPPTPIVSNMLADRILGRPYLAIAIRSRALRVVP